MAAALSLTFGRGGALLGNLLFGMLIDQVCIVPIVLFGGLLVGKFGLNWIDYHKLMDTSTRNVRLDVIFFFIFVFQI